MNKFAGGPSLIMLYPQERVCLKKYPQKSKNGLGLPIYEIKPTEKDAMTIPCWEVGMNQSFLLQHVLPRCSTPAYIHTHRSVDTYTSTYRLKRTNMCVEVHIRKSILNNDTLYTYINRYTV